MSGLRYADSTVRAAIHYKHPSGEPGRFGRTIECEVDEQEYANLQHAFAEFEQGRRTKKTYALPVKNREAITLRLDKIDGILHQARTLVWD
jgi:hypothetical protein